MENSFGILCARWICLGRTLFMKSDRAQKVVAASCMLHNMLMKDDKAVYCPPGFADFEDLDGVITPGGWRSTVPANSMYFSGIQRQNEGRTSQLASSIRNHLKTYLNSPEGSLSWQNESIFHTE